MIEIQKIKKVKKNDNVVHIGSAIKEMTNLTKEQTTYFKKGFSKEKLQYLKSDKAYIYCINTKKEDAQAIRVQAFKVHEQVKNEDSLTVICKDKENTLAFLEGLLLSNYQFLKYFKDKDKKKYKLKKVQVISSVSEEAIEELQNVVKAVYWARDMVNEPVSYLDAVKIAEEIQAKGKEGKYQVEVFEQTKIESLKMGGLIAVNLGSETPATFTVIEYRPKKAINKKPYILVGKGVVYDTGGLSLKPTANSMDFMKCDMGGAACMTGAIHAIALNKLPVHVIGLIPATDNRPGKNAYAPGDVITMFDGTTVEVLNTDAEGRMILADAIAYANKYNPEFIITAATLTGAAVRAVGVKTAVLMGNAKESYLNKLEKAGQKVHDRVVRFPFWDEWKDELKSDIADITNLGGPTAGMITAGKFLEHFTKNPFMHIDLSSAYLHTQENYKGKGGTGAGVCLLYEFFRELSN